MSLDEFHWRFYLKEQWAMNMVAHYIYFVYSFIGRWSSSCGNEKNEA